MLKNHFYIKHKLYYIDFFSSVLWCPSFCLKWNVLVSGLILCDHFPKFWVIWFLSGFQTVINPPANYLFRIIDLCKHAGVFPDMMGHKLFKNCGACLLNVCDSKIMVKCPIIAVPVLYTTHTALPVTFAVIYKGCRLSINIPVYIKMVYVSASIVQ